MKFVLEINCNGADMNDGTAISEALRRLADNIEGGLPYTEEKYGSFTLLIVGGEIKDGNGNTVGQWNVMEEEGG
jgi:hypothetical protein